MGRVLAFDYGKVRVGVAATDPMQIIASPVDTISAPQIFDFIDKYLSENDVEVFVVGMPYQMDNSLSENAERLKEFSGKLKYKYPAIPLVYIDERFTSKMASNAILQSGKKKKDRQNKGLVDKVSAVIILQSYMEQKK